MYKPMWLSLKETLFNQIHMMKYLPSETAIEINIGNFWFEWLDIHYAPWSTRSHGEIYVDSPPTVLLSSV